MHLQTTSKIHYSVVKVITFHIMTIKCVVHSEWHATPPDPKQKSAQEVSRKIDPFYQSHNASEKYLRMHNFAPEMCTFL